MNLEAQKELATVLRKARDLREQSWNTRRYAKTIDECAREAARNAPWTSIITCLLTAGYCEMWKFCDTVLGPESKP